MTDEISRLLGREQIREVVSRYARAIDRMDWELLRSCYHEDATDDHGVVSGSVDEFVEFFSVALLDFDSTYHFIGNVVIDFVADEEATAETYCVAGHWFTRDGESLLLETGVRYLDLLVDLGDGFRIQERSVILDWVRNGPADSSWRYAAVFPRGGRLPNNDLSYTFLTQHGLGSGSTETTDPRGES